MTRDQFIQNNPISAVLASAGVKCPTGRNAFKVLCPFHKDKKPSLSVDARQNVWNCHAGCGKGGVIDFIMKHENLTFGDFAKKYNVESRERRVVSFAKRPSLFDRKRVVVAPKPKEEEPEGDATIECVYSYQNQFGQEVFQTVRYKPKDFRQRHKEDGQWVWNLRDVERVLYHLPEVLKAKEVWLCYSPDTDVLTDEGWVNITQLDKSRRVAAYKVGSIHFEHPSQVQSFKYDGEMIGISTRFCDLSVTPDHKMLVRQERCYPKVIRAKEVVRNMSLPTAACFDAGEDLINADEARLLVAFAADGHVPKEGQQIHWGLKRDRKKIRLREILTRLSIPFVERKQKRDADEVRITIQRSDVRFLLKYMPQKSWGLNLMQLSLALRQLMIEELAQWDGHKNDYKSIKFDTTRKDEADAVSAIAVSSGYTCCINTVERPLPRKTIYSLSLIKKEWKTIGSNPRKQKPWEITKTPYSGNVFCCTVSTGFIIVRRNGRICVSGNTEGEKDANNLAALGFTATTSPMGASSWIDGYSEYLKGKDVVLCGDNDEHGAEYIQKIFDSLSGKAKSVRVIELPKEFKDVSDFIASFKKPEHALEALQQLRDSTHSFVKGYRITVKSVYEMQPKYKELIANKAANAFDLGSWLPDLKELRSLVPGECVLIVGGTGVGKTALASNVALAALPLPTIFFELELPDELLFERLVAARHNLKCTEVEEEFKKGFDLTEQQTRVLFENLFICSESVQTIEDIEEQIAHAELKTGVAPKVVVIDYIQLVSGKGDRRERISDAAEEIKRMAKRRKVIVILISQISRPTEGKNEVSLYDAKESGSLENSSGLVIGIWRDEKDSTLLHGRILKNTKGKAGKRFRMNFDGDKMIISPRGANLTDAVNRAKSAD